MQFTRAFAFFLLSLGTGAPLYAQSTGASLPAEITQALSRGDYATARTALAPLAATPGTPEGHYRYGKLLYEGKGGPQDRAAALGHLGKAVDLGHSDAAVFLARIHLTGATAGVPRDPARAADLLARAAAENHAEAQYYLALLHRAGDGIAKDNARARALLTAAAEQGFAEAQFELSKLLSETGNPEADPEEALRWLETAADTGHSRAQLFLANALETGRGATQDKAAALPWFRRAAEGGLPIAQRILGTKYLSGDDGVAPNPNEALRWLHMSATAGDPGAMNNLAIAYGGDHGVPRDDARALHWLRLASETGLARATYTLAQYHETGRGTPQDMKSAGLLYRLAAQQGDKRGTLRLGQLASQGALDRHVPPHLAVDWVLAAARTGDTDAAGWLRTQAEGGLRGAQTAYALLLLDTPDQADQAVPLLERAALAGDIEAQFQLGTLYTTGQGLPLDYVAGHKWLNIAATGGHGEAAKTRETLGALMTPDQIAKAQAEAREFFATASERLPDPVKANRTDP